MAKPCEGEWCPQPEESIDVVGGEESAMSKTG